MDGGIAQDPLPPPSPGGRGRNDSGSVSRLKDPTPVSGWIGGGLKEPWPLLMESIMPESVCLEKAELRQLDADFNNEINPENWMKVQFNPETLKLARDHW